jgi:phosphatidate cytidylyltransferase
MLLHRCAVAVPLLGLVLAVFLLPAPSAAVLFCLWMLVLAGVAGRELLSLFQRLGVVGYGRLTLSLGCLYLLLWAAGLPAGVEAGVEVLLVGGLVFSCFALSLRAGRPSAATLAPVWASLAVFIYLFWSLSFLVRLFFLPEAQGPWLALYVVVITKLADTGAYIAGSLTARRARGNHKLIPAISPKKSWEGLLGGTLASVVGAVWLLAVAGDRLTVGGVAILGWPSAVLLGILGSLVGLLGDLAESALKRAAEVKDSGHLPGLGGALDLLDSLIPMAPLFYAYVRIASGS